MELGRRAPFPGALRPGLGVSPFFGTVGGEVDPLPNSDTESDFDFRGGLAIGGTDGVLSLP